MFKHSRKFHREHMHFSVTDSLCLHERTAHHYVGKLPNLVYFTLNRVHFIGFNRAVNLHREFVKPGHIVAHETRYHENRHRITWLEPVYQFLEHHWVEPPHPPTARWFAAV